MDVKDVAWNEKLTDVTKEVSTGVDCKFKSVLEETSEEL